LTEKGRSTRCHARLERPACGWILHTTPPGASLHPHQVARTSNVKHTTLAARGRIIGRSHRGARRYEGAAVVRCCTGGVGVGVDATVGLERGADCDLRNAACVLRGAA